jgi:GH25 family lysozyme M1 (1,4-beta-N-acetylmuramidase)
MGTSRGIDVSAYQKPQDWASLKDSDGLAFAFAKASEGTHTRDSRFATHIKGIKAAGLVPGAYHFGWPAQSVTDEAANYTAAVKPYAGPGFVHWLDLERRNDGANYGDRTAAQIKSWAAQWIALVRNAFPGQRVGVYTSGSDIKAGHVPDGVPLWYPQYPWSGSPGFAKAEDADRPAPSGTAPLFWQFTSTPLDRDICYLSEADLRSWAAGEEDDVPIRTSLGKSADQELIWGEWTTITWDVEHADPAKAHASGSHPGYIAPHSSWADFNGHLVLDGIPVGGQVQIRYEVHDWKDGKSAGSWSEVVVDANATPGTQTLSVPFSKSLKKGQHVYVAVRPFAPSTNATAAAPATAAASSGAPPSENAAPATPTAALPAPRALSGRWTARQDQ